MRCHRWGTSITKSAADQLASKLYEVAYRSPGPVLYIADEPDESLEVVTRAAREAGRRYPIIAGSRDGEVRPPDQAVHLAGSPAAEIRGLPLRFGAAVICAESTGERLPEELAALSGKLVVGARVLLLDVFVDGTEEQFGHGELEFRERLGTSALLIRRGDSPRRDTQSDRKRRPQRRRSRTTGREQGLRRDLAEVRVQARASHELAGRLREELETLGVRLTRTEAAQAGLAGELARVRALPQKAAVGVPVTVVIAIHNAFDELGRCFDSVLAHTPAPHEVLLVNDSSTDERVAPLLEQYAKRSSRVTVLTNSENRGYTATINVGCDWAKGDVVLLNSDTEVPSRWLDGLRAVAMSRQDVATVTPVSNAAGAFSVPDANVDCDLPEGISLAEMSALVAYLSPRRRPLAPTGNGFCMYIRRAALDLVGAFDEESFPRGYGEENDFSQRAEAAGFVNLIDDATFVYHKRSASFGIHRADLVAAAKERMRVKHPDYPRAVKQFLADDPLRDLRLAVAGTLRRGPAEVKRLPHSRPTALLVLHSGRGGTPETNRDMASSLSASFRCLTLSCDVDHWVLSQIDGVDETELGRFDFEERWRIREPIDEERKEALRALMQAERVALVHVRSFIATGPEIVELVKELGLPLVCSLHDFYTVCPTIQLIDEHEHYCAGHCTPGRGPCPTSKRWVGAQPDLKDDYVHRWRSRMREQLSGADAFVTTSHAAKAVLIDHFGFMDDGRFRIIEHGRDVHHFRAVSVPPAERPRIVVFGALGISKGTTLLTELLRIDAREGPAFEFHFVGARHPNFSPEELGGVAHDAYDRADLPGRLAEIRPSFALVTSIWPETYCHTLTEAWMADLPVFASDIGTLRERITRHGGGWLLDYTDPEAFYAQMRVISDSTAEWHLRRAEIASISPRTVDDMAADYRSLYRALLQRRAAA